MTSRKQRVPRIGLDFGKEATTITGIQQNADGSLTLLEADGTVLPVQVSTVGSAYDRPKGPKVTFEIPDGGERIGSVSAALARFTRIIGVDTNSRTLDDELTCVTAVCELVDHRYEGPRWHGRWEPLWALEFRQPTKESERVGWLHALEHGKTRGWLSNDASVLLVVDAHREDLHRINRREAPLIDDFVLPPSVSIAYASADAAADSPINTLIARCDRVARGVLDYVAREPAGSLPPLVTAERTPFRAYRYWVFA